MSSSASCSPRSDSSSSRPTAPSASAWSSAATTCSGSPAATTSVSGDSDCLLGLALAFDLELVGDLDDARDLPDPLHEVVREAPRRDLSVQHRDSVLDPHVDVARRQPGPAQGVAADALLDRVVVGRALGPGDQLA